MTLLDIFTVVTITLITEHFIIPSIKQDIEYYKKQKNNLDK